MSKRRNPVVRHANILRKGGAHQTSRTGQRHSHKQATYDEADAYIQQRQSTRTGADDDCPQSSFPAFHPFTTPCLPTLSLHTNLQISCIDNW